MISNVIYSMTYCSAINCIIVQHDASGNQEKTIGKRCTFGRISIKNKQKKNVIRQSKIHKKSYAIIIKELKKTKIIKSL